MAKNLAQFAKQLVAATSAKMRRACLDALLQEPDPLTSVKPINTRPLMPQAPQITITSWSQK